MPKLHKYTKKLKKEKLINDSSKLKEIKEIGKKDGKFNK